MKSSKIIKCISCGTYNKNRAYCENCGAVLSYKERRAAEILKRNEQKSITRKDTPPSFIDTLKNHDFILYRFLGAVLYSGFLIVSAIGAFIAWLVFAIAAG